MAMPQGFPLANFNLCCKCSMKQMRKKVTSLKPCRKGSVRNPVTNKGKKARTRKPAAASRKPQKAASTTKVGPLQSMVVVQRTLPVDYKLSQDEDLAAARSAFGHQLAALTPSVARALLGKHVYALYDHIPVSARARFIEHIKLSGLTREKDVHGKQPFLKINDDAYQAFVSDGVYCTGSGSDPMYVFVH
jgi:hypothetical protein